MTDESATPRRFLTIEQASEELNVNPNQIRALIRAGELRGIQVGGCGYLARLRRLMTIVPELRGEEHPGQRRVFARFVRIAGLRRVAANRVLMSCGC